MVELVCDAEFSWVVLESIRPEAGGTGQYLDSWDRGRVKTWVAFATTLEM